MNKNKMIVILGIIVLIAIIVGMGIYFYQESKEVKIPSYGTNNPLESKPDLNPVTKTNPFNNVKTNPFE